MENLEVWKDIIEYEGLYQISHFKRIKSLSKLRINSKGEKYFTKEKMIGNKSKVVLTKNKIERPFYVHKLYDSHFFSNIDLIGEIWVDLKDIKEVEGYYKISNYGRIKSNLKTINKSNGRYMTFQEKIINQTKHPKNGYYFVGLKGFGKAITRSVHRLVAINFLEKKDFKLEVNHIDSDKSNNNLDNLEWVSRAENQAHLSKTKKSTSEFVGVYLNKNNTWTSYIRFNGKRHSLGIFKTELEAHTARKDFESKNNIDNKYS
jgi:hypothetical protein